MHKTVLLLTLPALAAGLVAAGCGGDDDGGGDALTKEEFIAQGDENCVEADRELEGAEREAFGNFEQGEEPSSEQLEQFVRDDLVPNIQGQVDYLRDLNPPEADEEQITEALDTAQDGLDQIEEDPGALDGGPGGEQLNDAGQQLQEYGFEQCGN